MDLFKWFRKQSVIPEAPKVPKVYSTASEFDIEGLDVFSVEREDGGRRTIIAFFTDKIDEDYCNAEQIVPGGIIRYVQWYVQSNDEEHLAYVERLRQKLELKNAKGDK